MHKHIVITVDAAEYIRSHNIHVPDCLEGTEPSTGRLFVCQLDKYVCFLTDRSSIDSGFMVIDGRNADLFSTVGTPESLVNRLITAALSHLMHSVSIPYSWSAFTWDEDRRHMSFFAHSSAQGAGERVYMEREPEHTNAVFFYSIEKTAVSFNQVTYVKTVFAEAQNALLEALEKLDNRAVVNSDDDDAAIGNSISLALDFRNGVENIAHLDEWYSSRLTKDQRKFVDADTAKPIRLRGAAGTGKTLALCVKFLKDIGRENENSEPGRKRHLFLAHSGSNKERIIATLLMLDEKTGYLKGLSDGSIYICTLYELANDYMSSSYHTLNPIDLDAKEGRLFQQEIIIDILKKKKLRYLINYDGQIGESVALQLSSNSDSDIERLADKINREFEHIIDAEGIRLGNDLSEKYIKGDKNYLKLGGWSEGERRLILDVHDEYKSTLEQNNLISVDQLVADYSRYLDSHVWDSLRRSKGYDSIYVDEAHLFNNVEQMILPKIMKKESRSVFVAFDLKQSSKDLSTRTALGANVKFGGESAEVIQLNQIFRFSKEIAELIEAVVFETGAFNHLDESDRVIGRTEASSSILPEIRLYNSDLELYNSVFPEARSHCETKDGRGQTAVICFDKKKFQRYAKAGNYKTKFLAIESKENIQELRYIGKRFVFTEPEFVAGHQFSTVYIVNLDASIFSEIESPLEKREMFSRLYLSLSRSSEKLVICCSKDGGGIPEHLKKVIVGGLAIGVNA
jgi:hypothetical protein